MTHQEASDLLAALSLNAVGPDESALVRAHVAHCPRCQAEIDALHEVAAALGNSVVPLPGRLWERISRRLTDPVEGHELLAPVGLGAHDGIRSDHRVARTLRSSRVRLASAASVAVGTAALATALCISLANANNQVAHLKGAMAEAAHAQIVAAMETQGHTFVTLTNVHNRDVAQFVLLPSGRGYLVTSSLPALPASETYQLWGEINNKTISLGLLGRAPLLATFTSAGAPRPYQLGVTVEAAGGARQPHGPMLATGTA